MADTLNSGGTCGGNYGFHEWCLDSPIDDNCEVESCGANEGGCDGSCGEAALDDCDLQTDDCGEGVPEAACSGCAGGRYAIRAYGDPNYNVGSRAQLGLWSGTSGGSNEWKNYASVNGNTFYMSTELYVENDVPHLNPGQQYPWFSIWDVHFSGQWVGGWGMSFLSGGEPSSPSDKGALFFEHGKEAHRLIGLRRQREYERILEKMLEK